MKIFLSSLALLSILNTAYSADITFIVDMNEVDEPFTIPEVNGNFNGWCGGCAPMSDADSDGVWELVISLDPGTYEYKFAYDTWAGQETLLPGSECTLTTGQFTNRILTVTGDAVLPTVCWGECTACGEGPLVSDVTFRLDMSDADFAFTTPEVNGTFNNWCGGCAPMSDADGDNIWEIVIPISGESAEYKFAYDNWAGQENLNPDAECTLTTDGFTNRLLNLTGDVILDVVCWESCVACEGSAVNEETSASFNVFPNPASDIITVNLEPGISTCDIKIIDTQGKVVLFESIFNSSTISLNLTDFNRGIYFVQVFVNSEVFTKRLILD
jgi:hypothetical protein